MSHLIMPPAARAAWTPPAVVELPPLTQLTLQTGIPIVDPGLSFSVLTAGLRREV